MGEVAAGLRNVYDAPTVEAAEIRFKEFATQYEPLYPAAVASVRDAWTGIIPLLDLPREVRKAIYSTNMIESFSSRVRSAVERHGRFPNELAARKVVYLVVKGHGGWSKRTDPARKVNNWKLVLNQLVLHFGDRLGL